MGLREVLPLRGKRLRIEFAFRFPFRETLHERFASGFVRRRKLDGFFCGAEVHGSGEECGGENERGKFCQSVHDKLLS